MNYADRFRVGSSETFKNLDGETVNEQFQYKYVVYQCAHFGKPRKRGTGERQSLSYLPNGCTARLRLNYQAQTNQLVITTLNNEHVNHPPPEACKKSKLKRISPKNAGKKKTASDSKSF